ncbi:MAG TPA: glycine cleavage T C-terminal barrel domain-containing protein [Baekduia sp.]|uniref:CAF17-like 4Fe-4S cluster assembly/insertion protein YgfZ n=1 Tax=Baekduia sp. TaxID=2600305 RepID=UPI002B85310C|nr:glycine cleavage T C-terminal barrel domain-containing protein [Baekduia sp.]HMJ34732.1 glycine cleavage T C-terminal barrel domain-containing protein [Baekduia sp.]
MATVDALSPAYEACTRGAGLIDRSAMGKLLLVGDEAAKFLDGQVSNDIATLEAGHGRYATLLTNKGRMLGDLRILAMSSAPPALLLITERVALQALFDQVRRGLIGWQAELHKRTLELALFSLVGARAEEVAAAAGLPIPGPDEHDVAGEVVRTAAGLDVLPDAERAASVRDALLAAGAVEAPEAVAEIVRVEAGRPRYGVELDETVMPEEAGIVDRAVSFTKGCYVGQETVARLHWKGKPNRHLRGLTLAAPVDAGATVRTTGEDGREVGTVGSVVVSPRAGVIALAILRREVAPGDRVTVGPDGVAADVVAPPFA